MGVSKVIYGNQTVMDISNDTVTPQSLLSGATAHSASGEAISGTANPGHVIKNASGTSLTQRTILQFGDGFTTADDSTNQKTTVNLSLMTASDMDDVVTPLPGNPPDYDEEEF